LIADAQNLYRAFKDWAQFLEDFKIEENEVILKLKLYNFQELYAKSV